MIHGRVTCSGTIGKAMRAILSEGRPASISFRPVTLSAAANAICTDIYTQTERQKGRKDGECKD